MGQGDGGLWEQHQLCSAKQPGQETGESKIPGRLFLVPTVFLSPCSSLARDGKEPLGMEGLTSSLSGKGLI